MSSHKTSKTFSDSSFDLSELSLFEFEKRTDIDLVMMGWKGGADGWSGDGDVVMLNKDVISHVKRRLTREELRSLTHALG